MTIPYSENDSLWHKLLTTCPSQRNCADREHELWTESERRHQIKWRAVERDTVERELMGLVGWWVMRLVGWGFGGASGLGGWLGVSVGESGAWWDEGSV